MWGLPKVFVSRMREICAEVSDADVWVSGTMPVLWECYECREDGASVGEVPVGVRGDVNRVGSNVICFRGCRRCPWGRCEIYVPKVSDAKGLWAGRCLCCEDVRSVVRMVPVLAE